MFLKHPGRCSQAYTPNRERGITRCILGSVVFLRPRAYEVKRRPACRHYRSRGAAAERASAQAGSTPGRAGPASREPGARPSPRLRLPPRVCGRGEAPEPERALHRSGPVLTQVSVSGCRMLPPRLWRAGLDA